MTGFGSARGSRQLQVRLLHMVAVQVRVAAGQAKSPDVGRAVAPSYAPGGSAGNVERQTEERIAGRW